jgi:RNA polymerase sigma-70 factor (ECF subfamily)
LVIKMASWMHTSDRGAATRATLVISSASSEAVSRALPTDARTRLDAMVRAHFEKLWRFMRRLGLRHDEVDDALQEVIVIAAHRLRDIQTGSEQSFLFSTAYRVAARSRKRHASRREVPDEAMMSEVADPGLDPEEASERARARALVDQLLSGMPMELRAVFVLYEIEEHTMAEIAAMLELPAGTVASRLRRARADFESRVERTCGREAVDFRTGSTP